jgi:hypothetical protein
MKNLNFAVKTLLALSVGYSTLSMAAPDDLEMTKNSSRLDQILTLQNLKSVQSLSRDCLLTETHKTCVSLFASGADTQQIDSAMGGVMVAFRPSANFRLGAYLEQAKESGTSSGGVSLKKGDPGYGLFATWSQDPDGSGMHVRAAANVGNVFIETTRIGTDLKPHVGFSDIQSQSFQIDLIKDYAFGGKWVLSPYIGYREIRNNRLAYVELLQEENLPRSYSELKQDINSISVGASVAFKVSPSTKLALAAGVDKDVKNKIDPYASTATRSNDNVQNLSRDGVVKQKINTLSLSLNHQLNNTSVLGFSVTQRKLDNFTGEMVFGSIQYARSF